MKLVQQSEKVMGNIFTKYFSRFEGLGPKSRTFVIYEPIPINQKLITMSL